MSRRALAVLGTIVLLLIVVIVLMPRAESGASTRALRRFLAASGVDVSGGGSPPSTDGVFVLLHDLRSTGEAEALLAWASDGGRLVVADPASEVMALAGASVGEPLGLVGAQRLEPACVAEEAVGVRRIVARASDRALRGDRFVSCYRGLILARRHGDGTVVLMGGWTALTNEHLRAADNAVFALRLAGGRSQVVFGAPRAVTPSGPSSSSLWTALPGRAKAVILAMVASAAAFAAVRARRLGRPLLEEPLTPIPASELVHATGRLFRRGRDLGNAAASMRRATRARLGRRLGVDGDREELLPIVARATGLEDERVERILGSSAPATDEELVRLGSLLADVEARAKGGRS